VGTDAKNSCVDAESRVHGSKNLFLGGCNVIPTQIACNPTLTAICYAIVGADAIVADLKAA
jgi:choline dehydrogenase-like flavoprotein